MTIKAVNCAKVLGAPLIASASYFLSNHINSRQQINPKGIRYLGGLENNKRNIFRKNIVI